ncbi:hypothetical protein ACO0KY_10670 [Undibacterium sp. Dicai25W]|uniref:hypothetical protein n=1 Tax=Undibacterium sp. Dicai25W TaxID=3413034 RepID=UPI003BF0A3FC
MTKSTKLKAIVAGVLITIIALIYGGPWILYFWGLEGMSGKPALPTVVANVQQQQVLWEKAGCEGTPTLVELDPVSYFFSAGTLEAPPPATIFAWRIAAAYQREHQLRDGASWQQLSGSAMVIWITRHWTIEQILSKTIELDAKQKNIQHP